MSDRDQSLLPDFIGGSYAARLGVALVFAISVMFAFGVVISVQASETLENDVEQEMTSIAETQAGELDAWIESTQRSVRAASDRSELNTRDTEGINRHLETLVESGQVSEHVAAVHYLDTETMTFLASSNEQFVGVDPREQGASFATDGGVSFDGPHDTHVSQPFEVPIADHPVIAVISPVTGEENRALVYMTDLRAKSESVSRQRGDSTTTVVNRNGQFVSHPNGDLILDNAGMSGELLGAISGGETRFVDGDDELVAHAALQSTDWVVSVSSDRGTALALASQINSNLVGLVLFAIINLGLVGVTVGANTVTSLRRLSGRAREMGEGDLDVDLSSSRGDEIGTLYASLDRMRVSLRENIQEAEAAREDAEEARRDAEAARQEAVEESQAVQRLNERLEAKATEYRDALNDVADGDLTCRVDPTSENEAMASVGEEINETLDALEEIIATTQSFAERVLVASDEAGRNAERVDDASKRVRDSTHDIFEGASEQSERLQDAAAEMEGLSAAAQEVAASAQQVADTSRSAANVGERGREAAQDAIEEMNAIDRETDETVDEITELADDLTEISDIVDLITEIVEQTNMLALNASIEAARADAGGEGFAVVADEIKGLAEETKEAASDIEDRIERIQSQADETVDTMEHTSQRVRDGTETVEEAIEALEQIVEYTEEVDVGIQEIDDATEEQAETTQQMMTLIDELTEISQETATEADSVAEAADEQADSITDVAGSARDLRESAEALDSLLDQFTVTPGLDATESSAIDGTPAFSGGDR